VEIARGLTPGQRLAQGALVARIDARDFEAQVVMARFYAEQVLPRCIAYGAAIRAGSGSIMALSAENF